MATAAPRVLAAVLHYGSRPDGGSRELLASTLDSLLAMDAPGMTLAVVDNGSTDGGRELVRERYPSVVLIENGENLGVAEGYNAGIRAGLARGADWVLLLNNDIAADPGMLSALLAAAKDDPAAGILGPKTYFHDAPRTLWYAGGKVNLFTGIIAHRGIRETDRGQYDAIGETGYVNGCAMLIRRSVIDRIGLLDPAFHPAYAEDADYSMRARRAGFKLLYVPTAMLWHRVSSSSGGGATPFKTRLKAAHNFLVIRRYARWYHWLTIPWCAGATATAFVARELLRGNFAIVGALVDGLASAFRRRG
jgi:GT2 family glycosyltransferase